MSRLLEILDHLIGKYAKVIVYILLLITGIKLTRFILRNIIGWFNLISEDKKS